MNGNGSEPDYEDDEIGPRDPEAWEAWMWDEPATITLTRREFSIISDALHLYAEAVHLFEFEAAEDEPTHQRCPVTYAEAHMLSIRTDPHTVDTERFAE